jgi:hypothetical protein
MSVSFSHQVSTPGSTVITTKGDILSHDGTSSVRFPVGTNGQVLSAQSTTSYGLSWTTAPQASTSYYTKILYSELTAHEASEYLISNIPSDYKDIRLIVQGKTSSTSYSGLYISAQLNSDTVGTNYPQQHADTSQAPTKYGDEYNSGDALGSGKEGIWSGGSAFGNSSGFTAKRGTFDLTIYSYASTDKYKTMYLSAGATADVTYSNNRAMGFWKSTSAVTSIKLFVNNSQTLGVGTVIALYGIK